MNCSRCGAIIEENGKCYCNQEKMLSKMLQRNKELKERFYTNYFDIINSEQTINIAFNLIDLQDKIIHNLIYKNGLLEEKITKMESDISE